MFEFQFGEINYLAVIVAAIASFMVGGVWYAALFGKTWVQLHGYTEAQTNEMAKSQVRAFATFFVCDLVMATVLALVLINLGAANAVQGAVVGFVAWIGFVATTHLTQWAAHRKPVAAYLIDASYQLTCLVVMGLILGAWR